MPPNYYITRHTVFASRRRGKLPGGWFFVKYMLYHFGRGIFCCAQYDGVFFTSFCQCQVSKLACKGLRTKIFIRRRHFAKMQNDSFKMRQHYAPYNRSEESHRKSAWYICRLLTRWDISLALNMTHFLLSPSGKVDCKRSVARR